MFALRAAAVFPILAAAIIILGTLSCEQAAAAPSSSVGRNVSYYIDFICEFTRYDDFAAEGQQYWPFLVQLCSHENATLFSGKMCIVNDTASSATDPSIPRVILRRHRTGYVLPFSEFRYLVTLEVLAGNRSRAEAIVTLANFRVFFAALGISEAHVIEGKELQDIVAISVDANQSALAAGLTVGWAVILVVGTVLCFSISAIVLWRPGVSEKENAEVVGVGQDRGDPLHHAAWGDDIASDQPELVMRGKERAVSTRSAPMSERAPHQHAHEFQDALAAEGTLALPPVRDAEEMRRLVEEKRQRQDRRRKEKEEIRKRNALLLPTEQAPEPIAPTDVKPKQKVAAPKNLPLGLSTRRLVAAMTEAALKTIRTRTDMRPIQRLRLQTQRFAPVSVGPVVEAPTPQPVASGGDATTPELVMSHSPPVADDGDLLRPHNRAASTRSASIEQRSPSTDQRPGEDAVAESCLAVPMLNADIEQML